MFENIDLTQFVPYALFVFAAVVAWLILQFVLNRGNVRAEERLDELQNPNRRRKAESVSKGKGDSVTNMLEKASPALAKPLQPKDEEQAGKLKTRLSVAGFRRQGASTVFLGMKVACSIAGFMLGGGPLLISQGVSQDTLMYTGIIVGAAFFLPDVAVWWIGRSRKMSIFLGLPDSLDLLVVCVEAGLGLDQAMRRVADEMKDSYRVISDEFSLSNLQLQMGRSRTEVLKELGARTGVDDLRSLATILIQADKFGSSIAQALRVQSDAMRTRRRQIAEEKAAKTAVKLIFPLVIFIFPGIFVVLVGPAAITMVNEMFPAMQAK